MAKKGTNKTQKAEIAPDPVETTSGALELDVKPTKPRHFRKRAQEEIGKNYPSIVRRLAEEATQGSVMHTKLLFDLGGVKEEVRDAGKGKRPRRPPSLGKILPDEVAAMKREKERAAAQGDKGALAGSAEDDRKQSSQ